MMSTEKGSARGLSTVPRGTTEIGLKHPASNSARIPTERKPVSFTVFMHNSLSDYPRWGGDKLRKTRTKNWAGIIPEWGYD
jgi:hypothetical protein